MSKFPPKTTFRRPKGVCKLNNQWDQHSAMVGMLASEQAAPGLIPSVDVAEVTLRRCLEEKGQ